MERNFGTAQARLVKGMRVTGVKTIEAANQVRNDYRFPWGGKLYQIERQAVTTGLRGAKVRVEQRLDGTLAVRHGERYLPVEECVVVAKPKAARPAKAAKPRRARGRGSDWNKNFDMQKGPKVAGGAALRMPAGRGGRMNSILGELHRFLQAVRRRAVCLVLRRALAHLGALHHPAG